MGDSWNKMLTRARQFTSEREFKKRKSSENLMMEIMLQLSYPRLDIAVSKGLNHLLKAPFCVHPKTGRVCVPFDVDHADKFNPEDVSTLSGLLDEIDTFSKTANEEEKKLKDYKKTSLKESINIFEAFLSVMAANWKGDLIAQSDKSMQF